VPKKKIIEAPKPKLVKKQVKAAPKELSADSFDEGPSAGG